MTKAELMYYVGKNVYVYFKDEKILYGKLGYVDKFSKKYDYRKPDYFFIGNTSFRVSHIKSVRIDIKSEIDNAYLNGYNCGYSQAISDFS